MDMENMDMENMDMEDMDLLFETRRLKTFLYFSVLQKYVYQVKYYQQVNFL